VLLLVISKKQAQQASVTQNTSAAITLCNKWSNTMHNNTYTVVGTSVLNNVCKIRFANGLTKRIRVLARNAHSNIALIECNAMQKLQAAQFALTQTEQFNEQQLAVIQAYVNANK